MSRRIVCFYEDASDAAVPVVLKCKDTLHQTIAEALSEFGLGDEPVTSYALCLNFQELTVRLSESEFHNLPTSGRPPQLRLISLQDLKALCASQSQHHTYFDDSRGPSASPETSAVHNHNHNHHQPNVSSSTAIPSSSTSSSHQQTVPKKRGRPSRASLAAAAASAAGAEEPQQPIYSGPVTTDTRKLWLAGGPGQGDDADTSQRYRKRRMVLGKPGASSQHAHVDSDDDSDQHTPEPANHETTTTGASGKRRSSGRPRRSAADNASHAIAESAANGGQPVSLPAAASIPSAAHKILPKSKKGARPSSSGSSSAPSAKKRKTDETDTSAKVKLTEVFDDVQQIALQKATLPLSTESTDVHAPLQIHEPLPDAYIAELQGRTEPNRSEYWIGFCFAEQPGEYILQRDIWVTYQRHTSQYGPGSPEGLSPSALIGLFSTVFSQGEAKVITSSTGEQLYVVVNVRAKRISTIYTPQSESDAQAQAEELKLLEHDDTGHGLDVPPEQTNETGIRNDAKAQSPAAEEGAEEGPRQSTPAHTQDSIAQAEPDASATPQQEQQHDSLDAEHELDDSHHDESAHTEQQQPPPHQHQQQQQEEGADPAFQVDAQADAEPSSAQVDASEIDQGMEPATNHEADPNERHEEEDVSMTHEQASEPQPQPELHDTSGPQGEQEPESSKAPERIEGTPELNEHIEPPPTAEATVPTPSQHKSPKEDDGHWPRVDFSQPPESPPVSPSKQDSPSPSSSEGDPLGQHDDDNDDEDEERAMANEWFGPSPTFEHFAHHSEAAGGRERQSEQLGQITTHDIEEIEGDEEDPAAAHQLNDRITVVSEEPHGQQQHTHSLSSGDKNGLVTVEASLPAQESPQSTPTDHLKDVNTFFYT